MSWVGCPRPLVTAAAENGAWKPGRLAVYVEHQMTDEVRALLPEVLRQCDNTPRVSAQWPALAVFVVEAIALVRDVEAAQRMRKMLEPFSGTNLMAGHLVLMFGSANRYLAILDHVLDRDTAGDQFRSALEMDHAMRSPVHEAETLLSFAAHLESMGETVEAASVRRKGSAIANRIGLKRRIPLAHRSVFTDDLSPREIDVLRLVALGMSNKEIGDELIISANTAANHVRSILMKTGSSNRTQAAVYAANHDIA